MKINRLSLLNSLFSIVNENYEEDLNYKLAYYFLEHYHKLPELNIYDVAADCYVSRSSIRRFCQAIGYDNFLDFKSVFYEYDDQYAYYMLHADRDAYRERLTAEINSMIQELNRRMNTVEVDIIIDRIFNSRYIVFLTSATSNAYVKDFQQAMVFHNKIIHIISDAYTNNTLIRRLDSRDYLITISATGTFAKASREYIAGIEAYKILFTYNRDEKIKEQYDKVYYLSGTDRTNEGRSVYGTYGLNYMLDILYSAYVRKYGNRDSKKKGDSDAL